MFIAKIEKNKLVLEAPIRFTNHLRQFEGQKVEIEVRKLRSQRSNLQNNYMWGVCYQLISEHTGYELEEVHEIMKFKFLRQKNTKGMEYVKSTAKLNTSEMETYLEKIKRWAAQDLSVVIPDPNM